LRSSAEESSVRAVVIIFLDPQRDGSFCFVEALVPVDPDFSFLEAAMEDFDVAIVECPA
jgi:hypothetical protein